MTPAWRRHLEQKADHLRARIAELDAELVEIEAALAADDGEDQRDEDRGPRGDR